MTASSTLRHDAVLKMAPAAGLEPGMLATRRANDELARPAAFEDEIFLGFVKRGRSGNQFVQISHGRHLFNVAAGDTPRVGDDAFLHDPWTVTTTPGVHWVGRFTLDDTALSGQWMVDVSAGFYAGPGIQLVTSLAMPLAVSGAEALPGGGVGLLGFRSVTYDVTPLGAGGAGSGLRVIRSQTGGEANSVAGVLQGHTVDGATGLVVFSGECKVQVSGALGEGETFVFLPDGRAISAAEDLAAAGTSMPTAGAVGHLTEAAAAADAVVGAFLYGNTYRATAP